jgi:hypothetical protein
MQTNETNIMQHSNNDERVNTLHQDQNRATPRTVSAEAPSSPQQNQPARFLHDKASHQFTYMHAVLHPLTYNSLKSLVQMALRQRLL